MSNWFLSSSLRLGLVLMSCFLSPLGTLFRASQFLAEELPIRLAHRVQELDSLPDGLNDMPSVKKVQDWYAQSFEVRDTGGDLLFDEGTMTHSQL